MKYLRSQPNGLLGFAVTRITGHPTIPMAGSASAGHSAGCPGSWRCLSAVGAPRTEKNGSPTAGNFPHAAVPSGRSFRGRAAKA